MARPAAERPARPPLAPELRQTRQRALVWGALQQLSPHCTAEEIGAHLEAAGPGLARSTVYRSLDALVRSGAVRTLRPSEGPTRYEVEREAHQHAICQVCGAISHLEHELVSELEHHLEQLHHFKPVRTEVVVMGVCATCAQPGARRRPPPAPSATHTHFHAPAVPVGGTTSRGTRRT